MKKQIQFSRISQRVQKKPAPIPQENNETPDYKKLIENRYRKSICNKMYQFPRTDDQYSYSDSHSYDSLEAVNCNLFNQNRQPQTRSQYQVPALNCRFTNYKTDSQDDLTHSQSSYVDTKYVIRGKKMGRNTISPSVKIISEDQRFQKYNSVVNKKFYKDAKFQLADQIGMSHFKSNLEKRLKTNLSNGQMSYLDSFQYLQKTQSMNKTKDPSILDNSGNSKFIQKKPQNTSITISQQLVNQQYQISQQTSLGLTGMNGINGVNGINSVNGVNGVKLKSPYLPIFRMQTDPMNENSYNIQPKRTDSRNQIQPTSIKKEFSIRQLRSNEFKK